MSKSPFLSISSHELKILTDFAFGTFQSASHFVAVSLEPVVETAMISCLIGSDSSRGRRMSGRKTPAMLKRLRNAQWQVN